MKLPFILFAFLLISPSTHLENAKSTSSFNMLLGEWQGNGTLMGNTANFKMTWRKSELHKDIYKLSFENNFKSNSGEMFKMKAQASYQSQKNIGYWIDSRGEVLKLAFKWNENALIVEWGDPSSEEGRTTYTITDNNSLEVVDEVLKEGQYYKFGEASYVKKE